MGIAMNQASRTIAHPCTGCLATAPSAGAIAIIQLHGDGARGAAEQLCRFVPDRRARLAQLADIDQGLVAGLDDHFVQIMPHGGQRVVQRLLNWLAKRGVDIAAQPDPTALFPEASSPLEAHMLAWLGRAASPAAVDLLLDQPRRWRQLIDGASSIDARWIIANSRRLDRLVSPPIVALIGPANVGKSTLTNHILGRAVSVVADLPGTTRDWVGGLGELTSPHGLVAVHWADTPGQRPTGDPIERQAQQLSREVVGSADVVVAMRDDETDWPSVDSIDPARIIWAVNKADRLVGRTVPDAPDSNRPIVFSALRGLGLGLGALEAAVIERLGLGEGLDRSAPWAFCPALRQAIDPVDPAELRRLVYG